MILIRSKMSELQRLSKMSFLKLISEGVPSCGEGGAEMKSACYGFCLNPNS
jgi:hypothetical protein